MKTKSIIMMMTCCGLMMVGCANKNSKKVETAETESIPYVITGNDRDEHGCIGSAGYTWSEVQKDCIRLWEKGVRMQSVDDAQKSMFIVFSPDSTQVELFFSGEGAEKDILDRYTLPSGGYVWNVEDDDTKNVGMDKNGEWTVSQRGKLIYRQDKEDNNK